MNNQEKFRQILNDVTQSTKNTGNQLGKSLKNFATRVNILENSLADTPLKVKYKNWQGETSIRTIIPLDVWYGHTEYHLKDQWLMDVWDMDKDAQRTYAMLDIIEFIKE